MVVLYALVAGCSTGTDWGPARSAVSQAAGAIGSPASVRLAEHAVAAYGNAAHRDPSGASASELPTLMTRVVTANYQTVENTVAYGHHAGACPNPLYRQPPDIEAATIGDPRALAYTIGGISRSAGDYSSLTRSALNTAASPAPGPVPLVPVVAVAFLVESRDAQAGSRRAELTQQDQARLDQWAATTFPPGPAGSRREALSTEAGLALDRGRRQADACLGRRPQG